MVFLEAKSPEKQLHANVLYILVLGRKGLIKLTSWHLLAQSQQWKQSVKSSTSAIVVFVVKGYLCYKIITSQNVSSEAQIKKFFIS